MTNNILQFINISAHYNTDIVFESVSFKVNKGDFVGLLGANGSGKTTLLKLIAGELTPRSGHIIYKNVRLISDSIAQRIDNGIIYIHQFPITFPDLFAWENFLIWCSPLKKKKDFVLTKEEIIKFLTYKLSILELSIPLEKKVADLSEGESQILEFTRCFISAADLILIDEATSILDFYVSEKILTFLKQFCLKGGCVIFLSHRLNELKKYSDIIFELKDNTLKPYVSFILNVRQNTDISNFHKRKYSVDKNKVALEVQIEIEKRQKKFKLQLFQNEILGITGLDSSEYEHLTRKVIDIISLSKSKYSAGTYTIGKDFSFLGKNRETDWIFPFQTVEFNLLIANGEEIFISNDSKKGISQLVEYFNIFPKDSNKIVNDLSGGNKLKTALARTLLLKCPVNILDEPFTGIDTSSRAVIIEIIKIEADINKSSFVIFSKEYNELLKFCDRLIAFKNNGAYNEFEGNLATMQKDNLEFELFN